MGHLPHSHTDKVKSDHAPTHTITCATRMCFTLDCVMEGGDTHTCDTQDQASELEQCFTTFPTRKPHNLTRYHIVVKTISKTAIATYILFYMLGQRRYRTTEMILHAAKNPVWRPDVDIDAFRAHCKTRTHFGKEYRSRVPLHIEVHRHAQTLRVGV
jgi:hypothetical protein